MRSTYKSEAAHSVGGLGFHTFPEPIVLDPDKKQRLHEIGRIGHGVLTKIGGLTARAMAGEQDLEWLAKLMLGSIPTEYHSLARELMIAVGKRSPVQFFRADVVGNGKIAELQCPGSGWSHVRGLEEHYCISTEDSGIIKSYRHWANGRPLSWWLHDKNHEDSVYDFCAELRKAGIAITLATTAEDFDAEHAVAIIKRLPLPELIAQPKGRRLLERWLNGEVELDLLPTMAPETKYLMALLHHPGYRRLFTDEERNLCPYTTVIYDENQPVEHRRAKTVREAIERFPREFIIKYGGAEKYKRGGCHAVHYLGSCKPSERLELMSQAIASAKMGEGWILQEFVVAHCKVPSQSYFSGREREYYCIFRPHYYRNHETGLVETVNMSVTARSDWKVHARSDAWLGICT